MNNPFKRKYPSFAHVVIDTETVSLSPTAAVMSIGMINFDLHTGEIRSEIQINADFQYDVSYLDGHESQETLEWWKLPAQKDALRLSTERAYPLPEALHHVAYWLDQYLPDLWDAPHKCCVWTMGSEFDPPILNQWSKRILSRFNDEAFLSSMHPKVPRDLLPRGSLADMRLLFKLWPGAVPRPKHVAHTALADAEAQYLTIMKYRRLGLLNGMFNQMRYLP